VSFSTAKEAAEVASGMLTRVRDSLPDVGIPVVLPIDLRPLLGGWVNYNENSTGIDRLYIGDWEGTPTVRVFGASRPAPIDWGEVAGSAFADGVGGHEAVGFNASYDLTFAQVLLAGYLNKRLLVVDAYSTFTDASGRANYFQRDHFYLP
jgi:hypothetical protein